MSLTITAAEKAILEDLSIPPRPQVLLTITQETKKAEPDVSVIAEAIASDVGISGAVLQIVNSAAFRRLNEIKSIHQAVMTLGINRVFPIVKAVALKGAMPASKTLDAFWLEANLLASCAAATAEELGFESAKDNAYMLGLFHQAGVPALLQSFPEYESLLVEANSIGWANLADQERIRYGTTHATVAALIAQQWSLPKVMVEAIYYQHDSDGLFNSEELAKPSLLMLAILKIARIVAYRKLGVDSEEQVWQDSYDSLLNFLNIEDQQLEDILAGVNSTLSEA
ncbi:HDOD domain-containing protein [Agarivorans sp. MS3-6]|uniref:HDOD domain-containing protein n=1 Tax=Agarivorans sp. TSD2052 TaxID=2937286 RepID=UPI002010C26C|nr:HDOD domain-containing protein [Agarivorans sp. TSD2052]UPW17742.1 HDOD domain-containing protein [Agarivorans sp. TSD2052]